MKLEFYIVIITLCSAFYLNSKAQQVYFNKQYPNTKYVGYSSLLSDSIYVYGIGYNVSNPATQKLLFAKHSYNGDTILVKSLLDNDTINYVSSAVHNLCKIKSNFFFIGGEEYTTQLINNEPKGAGFLLKINDVGETLLKKNFNPFNSYKNYLNSILAKSNNSLVVLGSNIKLDSLNQRQVKVYIANIDTLGNVIWEHEYGFNNQIAVTRQIIPSDDGGYYIPGSIDDTTTGIQYDYYLLKIDSVGNVVYQRQWGNPILQEGISSLKEMPNQQIYLTGSVTNSDFYYRRPFVSKIEQNGIMAIQNFFFQTNADIGFSKIFNHQDHFLTLAYYKEDGGYKKVAFFEFNSNLDSLNTIFFDFNGNQQLYDMIQLPDKGYLLGGFMRNPGQAPLYNAWLMRIDSNLCANTACIPVGIEELYQTFGQKTKIDVYPNPATAILNIELPNSTNYASFEFTEITGKVILHGQLNNSLNSIDINQYCKGIYFLKVKISEQEIITKKIIISN